ncbi:O-antigen ligase family protein [Pedobacter sp. MR2016-19]|uniref:O-antigen ligase family protein n=1 Tax=Pedobacter sp. MR2016-19 TaxID=2780089 RepID=UPI00187553C6|nr:O-antigen ligase family protein [Pedobacter sp. MR2016-19]MBE5318716.1 O-antigen ligase family protein [Pedobacter sp. MR2016-19]
MSIFVFFLRTRIHQNPGSIVLAILVAGLLQQAIGLLQMIGVLNNGHPYFRITGTFGNPGVFAGYLVSLLPLACYVVKRHIFEWGLPFPNFARYGCYMYLILCFFLLPLLDSRASWISGCLAIFIVYRSEIWRVLTTFLNKRWKKSIFSILTAILFLVAIYIIHLHKEDSSLGRVLVWKITIGIFSKNPIFGIGFSNILNHYNDYQQNYFATQTSATALEKLNADNVYVSFNEIIEFLTEEGLAGMLLLAAFVFAVFNSAKHFSTLRSMFVACLAVILLFACFSYPFHDPAILINICIFCALIVGRPVVFYCKSISFAWITAVRVTIFAGMLTCLIALFYVLPDVIRLRQIAKTVNVTDPDFSRSNLNRISLLLSHDPEYQTSKAIILYRKGLFGESLDLLNAVCKSSSNSDLYLLKGQNLEALKQYHLAEAAYYYALNIVPNRLLPRYMLFKLYLKQGDFNSAAFVSSQAVRLKEKVPSTTTNAIKYEMSSFLNKLKKSR